MLINNVNPKTGKPMVPSLSALLSISKAMGITIDELIEAVDDLDVDISAAKNLTSVKKKGVKIPVFASVAAGIPIEAVEDIIDYEEIDEKTAQSGTFFALKIKGDSMEPRICNGDVVIVRQQPTINSGEIAIVMVNGLDAACKKVIIQSDGIYLVSLNSAYAPMHYSKKQIEELPVRILGKVIELRGKF